MKIHLVSISPLPSTTNSSVPTSKDGTIDYSTNSNESYSDVHKNWGELMMMFNIFINFTNGTCSDGTYNTGDIEKRFVFHTIGDMEYYSGSMGSPSDFTNSSKFYNRLIIDTDFHSSVSYQSLIGGSGTDSNQTGKMMGKTRYFITSSDGTITLPSNHITKFSQPFKDQMINGTQNTNQGQLNVRYEDYSTKSFYRVSVTGGENQIRINSGKSSTDGDDKIIMMIIVVVVELYNLNFGYFLILFIFIYELKYFYIEKTMGYLDNSSITVDGLNKKR